MTDLSSLIGRLESATGPDRELDAAICEALGNKVLYDAADPNDRVPYWEAVKGYSWQAVPTYTASLDAAVTLVPDDLVINMGNDVRCWADIWFDEQTYDGLPYLSRAETLPLAICAAALKARTRLKDEQS